MSQSTLDPTQSVYRAIDEYNRSEDRGVQKSRDAVLLGAGGAVDSLGLVRLIMAVEQQVQDDFSTPVSLTDERAMSERNSPFRTVGSLIDFISQRLKETP